MKQLASPTAVQRPAESEANPAEEDLDCHCHESAVQQGETYVALDSCLHRN